MRSFDYSTKTADDYLISIDPEILSSLSPEQLTAFKSVLDTAIPKPSPKLVDLRFPIDLMITRFYVVLFIGKDRRKQPRRYVPAGIARVGNSITIGVFLLGANLSISAVVVLAIYLLKSAIGFDLLPGHFPELIKQLSGLSQDVGGR